MAVWAWLCLVCLASVSIPVHAQAERLRVTGDMPARANALPRAEFDAIVAEATELADKRPGDEIVPLPDVWRTLTRDKLAAMLLMPAFGQIPKWPRTVLTDQAATWDLFDFTRPSDAAVLWNRLWPPGDNPQPNHGGALYEPDPTWSPTSVAMLAVFSCLPSSIWSSQGDPQVWAIRKNLPWRWGEQQSSGGMPWDGIRQCLPDNVTYWRSKTAANAMVEQVAAILTRKFSDQVLDDGCSRSGPDDCLVLLQALYGLDHDNARLPDLLKRIEPSFGLDRAVDIPTTGTSSDPSALDGQRTTVLRRWSFLRLKLPVLLQHPHAWPPGELRRTVRQVMETTLVATRLRSFHRVDALLGGIDLDSANLWQKLEPAQKGTIADDMGKLGGEYAGRLGCGLAKLDESPGSPSFWQGYVVENIRLGHGDCGAIRELRLSLLMAPDATTRKRSVAVLQPIAAELTAKGEFRERALDEVTESCKGYKTDTRDPFKLCAGVAARSAAIAAAKKAAQPPVDPFKCGSEVIAAAEQAVHVVGNDYLGACRLDPSNRGRAIVAITYSPVDEKAGNPGSTDEPGDYDLDLAIFDVATGEVISHSHEAGAIPSDAIRFDSLTIDTGRYVLAHGRRAFGIRTTHSAHCSGCSYGTAELALYMPAGPQLSKVLETVVGEYQDNSTDSCPNGTSSRETTFSVGSGRSHGFADLVASTVTTFACNDEKNPPQKSKPEGTMTLHFDGHAYSIPEVPKPASGGKSS